MGFSRMRAAKMLSLSLTRQRVCFVLEFKMPNAEERERIWKITLPAQCPVAKDVDFGELARRYEMAGGSVKNALLRAATAAALRDGGEHKLTMADLLAACDAEVSKMGSKSSAMHMYS